MDTTFSFNGFLPAFEGITSLNISTFDKMDFNESKSVAAFIKMLPASMVFVWFWFATKYFR